MADLEEPAAKRAKLEDGLHLGSELAAQTATETSAKSSASTSNAGTTPANESRDLPPSSSKEHENDRPRLVPPQSAADQSTDNKEEIHPEEASESRDLKSRDLPPLHSFTVEKVLLINPQSKMVTVLGRFPDSEATAVILAEKQPISEPDLQCLFSKDTELTQIFQNDIYSQFQAVGTSGLGGLRLMTVYPATDAHIGKYSEQHCCLLHETPEDYRLVTKPFIEKQALKLEWVYNILEGRTEADRVVCSDPDTMNGFVLLPDMKWDLKDMNSLYMLAIARRAILSMRELNAEHLPLLKNILDKGKRAISETYSIPANQIRAYLHYQPSYYHLHVHFTHIKYEAPRTLIGQAHLLDDIIDNIENIDPLYYSKRTITCVVKETSPLWQEYVLRTSATK